MDPLFPNIPEDFSGLSDEDLAAFADETAATIADVRENPDQYVGEGRTTEELVGELGEGVKALRAARAELKTRGDAETAEPDADLAAAVEEVTAFAEGDDTEGDAPAGDGEGDAEGDGDDAEGEGDAEGDAAEGDAAEGAGEATAETVTAAGNPDPKPKPKPRLKRPARSAAHEPRDTREMISMTASAGGLGPDVGEAIEPLELARMMTKKRRDFGRIPRGEKGSKIPIAQIDVGSHYPESRTLHKDGSDQAKIDAVLDQGAIQAAFTDRRDRAREEGALVASGGLCAPVTPYYNLQMISVPDRPVRAALPAFNADRGGINAAQPLSLADIDTAVGIKTAAQDAAGGSSAAKTCQIVECPDFVETDVEIVYHCVQFGNLGARAYPERVAQANDLVLAAHARVAESQLLTNIGTLSTPVTAILGGNLGIVGDLLGQVLAAAAGMRSRHRMDPEAVLRALLPDWVLDEMLSDIFRSQFERFDTSETDLIGILREAGIEPSFYIDGAAGAGQVFGTQAPGALLPFPATVVWYLFPEGSFLYLDGGILELGIVRDSVLNATNDFQIFGESFENVAFIGVESLRVVSTVCDSGATSLPVAVSCPMSYAD